MDSENVSFRVANSDFSSAVSWVARSLPPKPAQPVLKGMLITATDDGLEISGYDYETSTQVHVAAQVFDSGSIAVAGKLLSEIISALPSSSDVSLTYDGSVVVVECGQSRFELPAIPIEDYPALPDLPDHAGSINPALFGEAVSQVAVAASKDETLPMLTGVFIDISGEEMTMATTDRFRLAVRRLTWSPAQPDFEDSVLVTAKTLSDAAKYMDAGGEDLQLSVSSGVERAGAKLLGISSRERKTTSRLLDAEFPKFRPLLPTSHSAVATVEIDSLLAAVKRVSLVADSAGQIRMEFTGEELVITAGGADAGRAREVLPCSYVGEPMVTAFNTSYLREGLQAMHSERVFFGFTESTRPVLLTPDVDIDMEPTEDGKFSSPDADFKYVLMPVRTA